MIRPLSILTLFQLNSLSVYIGAVNSMNTSSLELVNETFTLAKLPEKSKVIFQIDQEFLDRDPLQAKALLQHHQMRVFGLVADDCTHRHMGKNGNSGGKYVETENPNTLCMLVGGIATFRLRNLHLLIWIIIQ